MTVQDGWATTHPIAGTRWRGHTEEEDQLLEKELLSDERTCGASDAGRSRPKRSGPGLCTGTVRVEDYSHIERYSHVMHLVSTVTGLLAEHRTALDAVTALLPCRHPVWSPKVRAMELIEEVELTRRGLYGGLSATSISPATPTSRSRSALR